MKNLDVIKAKIMDVTEFKRLRAQWKLKNQKIVFTNGCFDLLHQGHIDYLAKAADLGQRLVIGLNADVSVKLLDKGASRPLQDEDSRAMILAALHFVDAIILFSDETPYELISSVQPDVLAKGGDYQVEQIAGHDIVLNAGGEVIIIPFLDGYSTTAIEKKILSAG